MHRTELGVVWGPVGKRSGQFGTGLKMELGLGYGVQERSRILQSIPDLGRGKRTGGLCEWFFLWDLSALCVRGRLRLQHGGYL